MTKIPAKIVHYSQHDPDKRRGGVERFARNLRLIFEDVEFMFAGAIDVDRIRSEKAMVICDNHWVADWPPDMPASFVAYQADDREEVDAILARAEEAGARVLRRPASSGISNPPMMRSKPGGRELSM